MSKQQGDVAELCFMYEATQQGLVVSTPHGEHAYDCIVDSGNNLLRVQVKSSSTVLHKNTHRYSISTNRGSKTKSLYTKETIDIIAVRIIPEDTWYFIPVEKVEVLKLHFYPRKENERFIDYRDNWDIFFKQS